VNNLSWCLYLSSVMDRLIPMFGTIGGVGLVVNVIWHILAVIDHERDVKPPRYRWSMLLVLCLMIATLLPSAKALQLIAASEFGERAFASERAQGIVDPGLKYIEKWLKSQLDNK
jgi:hypothetical protein